MRYDTNTVILLMEDILRHLRCVFKPLFGCTVIYQNDWLDL